MMELVIGYRMQGVMRAHDITVKSTMQTAKCFLLLLSICLLAACSKPEPVKIGFLGGLSGRVTDLGVSTRNGVLLAVEKQNASGGIGGRPIQLIIKDDKQDPETARQAVTDLINEKVEAIIGPATSSMAVAAVPIAEEAGVVMISPTVTANELTGKYKHFFRVIDSTSAYASKNAFFRRYALKEKRIAVVYDIDNLAYSESWLNDFRATFEKEGGRIVAAVPFQSKTEARLAPYIDKLLADRPDGILILANSVDTALLCQLIRKRDANITIGTSEWAGTEQLIELGGKAVEGIYTAQFIDRSSQHPEYQAFLKGYQQKFGKPPGFGGVAAYDAVNVVLNAIEKKKDKETLRDAIYSIRAFPGLQGDLFFEFDGNVARPSYITIVRDGQFKNVGE